MRLGASWYILENNVQEAYVPSHAHQYNVTGSYNFRIIHLITKPYANEF